MKLFTTLTLMAIGMAVTAPTAEAKCGPSSNAGYNVYKARPYKAAAAKSNADQPAAEADVTITGLWHTQFIAGDMVVDEGFDLWHADGTEVLNDATPTLSGNVCLGTWTKTGALTYSLVHPSWIYDDAGVHVIGIVTIREKITLDPGGDRYNGTVTFDAVDLDGKSLDHEEAKVAATRIKVE